MANVAVMRIGVCMGKPFLTSLDVDGWCIDDGEVAHAQSPTTFEIPPHSVRMNLAVGDTAKLRFYIRVTADDGELEDYGERMWVEVKGRIDDWYRGELLNQPDCTPDICPGWEVWFQPRHVIDAHRAADSA